MTMHHDDTAWLCWRYLLGELEETESAAFEDRLALDDEIAVVLADTARVYQAILLGGPANTTSTPRRASRSRLIALAATIAAVFCGLPALRWTGGKRLPATDLVALWSASEPAESSAEDIPDDVDESTADDVPGWLVAAVAIRPQPPAEVP